MRSTALLAGLVVAGAAAVSASAVRPGPEPALVTAGAGVLGAGVVGLAVTALGSSPDVDRVVVGLGSAALFVRVAVVHVVASPLRLDGVALTTVGVLTVGVVVGYRAADGALDGLRQGSLACGLGGVLCVLFVAYDVGRLDALTAFGSLDAVHAFDAVVAGSGVVLPVVFGLFGGVAGTAGWWLADYLSAPDALA